MARSLRDLDRAQATLHLILAAAIRDHQPALLQPLIDDDIVEATEALAATFETAERGVIYEHRPASLPAERLMTGLKSTLTEASKGSRSHFGRDAALVLRRIAETAREARVETLDDRHAFLEFLRRVLAHDREARGRGSDPAGFTPEAGEREEKRPPLIVP